MNKYTQRVYETWESECEILKSEGKPTISFDEYLSHAIMQDYKLGIRVPKDLTGEEETG